LDDHFDPRRLRVGQRIDVAVTVSGDQVVALNGLSFRPQVGQVLTVMREDDGSFTSQSKAQAIHRRLVLRQGSIETNFYRAARGAGVPQSILSQLTHSYAWQVDFQHDLRKGDRFAVMFERYFTEEGEPVRDGNVVHAVLTVDGRRMPIYRFEDSEGRAGYFDGEGTSIQRALMRTPIDGARISSGYGMRMHPILGYSMMHRGVDFAAPTGTPIYAAGDGIVEEIGWVSGYGRYIRLRHNGRYKTAYGHMSAFASGLSQGSWVAQGDVIGYVGSTGRSTGPHLHYEVMQEGKRVNPISLNLPDGRSLDGADLDRFNRQKVSIDARFAVLQARDGTTRLAQGAAGSETATR
jgi:murein DD-endopeptidase MepM/ murein hydrolase activator NlpD